MFLTTEELGNQRSPNIRDLGGHRIHAKLLGMVSMPCRKKTDKKHNI